MPARRLFALCCVVAALAAPAQGVVIDTGAGTGNTTAPVDDFGFDHVGNANGLSAIYLGWRWVLTANHVGERPVTLLGTVHQPIAGSSVRLDGPDPGTQPDLRVYRLEDGPTLPVLPLSSAPVSVGEEVHCAGNGWNREASPTEWDFAWNESPPPPLVAFRGYKRAFTGRALRWGRNEVSDAGFDQEIENSNMVVVSVTRAFATVFDESGGLPDELQTVQGDSGGGCFAKRGGEWELVGVMFSRSLFGGQDDDWAVFGNETVAADVDFYRAQILAIVSPAIPALPGAWGWVLAAGLLGSARAAGRPGRSGSEPRER